MDWRKTFLLGIVVLASFVSATAGSNQDSKLPASHKRALHLRRSTEFTGGRPLLNDTYTSYPAFLFNDPGLDTPGCGGVVKARPGYQYGHLVSPSWPQRVDNGVQCNWTMVGFDNVMLFLSDYHLRGRSCDQDVITITVPSRSKQVEQKYCDKKYRPDQRFLVVNDVPLDQVIGVDFHSSKSAVPSNTRFIVTWIKVPRFHNAYSAVPGRKLNSLPGKNRLVYLLYVPNQNANLKGRIDVTLKQASNKSSNCKPTYESVNIIDFAMNTTQTARVTCSLDDDSIHLTLKPRGVLKMHGPYALELKLKNPVTQVSFKNFKAKADKAQTDCKRTLHYEEGSGTPARFYSKFLKSDTGQYLQNTDCEDTYTIAAKSAFSSFIQFQTVMDVEESPECVYDYLLVGGQRLCGQKHSDKYISSPSDNNILEAAGTRYLNVLDRNHILIFDGVTKFQEDLLVRDSKNCLLSPPHVQHPTFEVDFQEKHLFYGILLLTGRPGGNESQSDQQELQISAFHGDRRSHYTVPDMKTEAWSGAVKYNAETLIAFPAPVSGRSIVIEKSTPFLSLCYVEVYINAADPVLPPRNVAYRHSADELTDGDSHTCRHDPSARPNITIVLPRNHTIFAVRIVGTFRERCLMPILNEFTILNKCNPGGRFFYNKTTGKCYHSEEKACQFTHRPGFPDQAECESICAGLKDDGKSETPRNFSVMVHENYKGGGPGKLCRFFPGNVSSGNVLIPCQRPLYGDVVTVTQDEPGLFLCEVLVFAKVEELDRNNIAHDKDVQSDLEPAQAGVIVDGDLSTCALLSITITVDLGQLYEVTAIVVSTGDDDHATFNLLVTAEQSPDLARQTNGACQTHDTRYDAVQYDAVRVQCNLTVGRYVTLQLFDPKASAQPSPGTTPRLAVCEIQVIAVPVDKGKGGLMNVALYKYTRLVMLREEWFPLTKAGDVITRLSHLTVDGIRDPPDTNVMCAHEWTWKNRDLYHDRSWWFVDLANVFHVHAITITPCRVELTIEYFVRFFSQNPTQFDRWNPARGFKECEATKTWEDRRYSISCQSPAPCRYVFLTNTDPTRKEFNLCLCEVQVWGKPLVSVKRFGADLTYQPQSSTWKGNIDFKSDQAKAGKGVNTKFTVNDLSKFTSAARCGGELMREWNTTIVSPNFPNNYRAAQHDNYVCQWMVHTPHDGVTAVWIDYLYFELEDKWQKDCFADQLMISNEAGQQKVLCQNMFWKAFTFQSYKDSFLYVTFMVRSPQGQKVVKRTGVAGFRIHISSYPYVKSLVVGVKASETGELASPFFPYRVQPYVRLRWAMTLSSDGTLTFLFLDIGNLGNAECSDSGVSIHNSRSSFNITHCYSIPPMYDVKVKVLGGDDVVVTYWNLQDVWRDRGFMLRYTFHNFVSVSDVMPVNPSSRTVAAYNFLMDRDSPVTLSWSFSSLMFAGKLTVQITEPSDLSELSECVTYFEITTVNTHSYHETKPGQLRICGDSPRSLTHILEPFTVLTVELKSDPNKSAPGEYVFSMDFDKFPTDDRNVLVAKISNHTVYVNPGWDVPFGHIELIAGVSVVDKRKIIVMTDGVYVLSLRVDPPYPRARRQDLCLWVNGRQTQLTAYGGQGRVSSVSGVFSFLKGDTLSVTPRHTPPLETNTMITLLYVSPLKGGHAFLALQGKKNWGTHAYKARTLMFTNILTSVGGFPTRHPNQIFSAPQAGIYWITMRLDPGPERSYDTVTSLQVYLEVSGRRRALLIAIADWDYPSSVSGAVLLDKGDKFQVQLPRGQVSDDASLLSCVYLYYNQRTVLGNYDHVAFTGVTAGDKKQKERYATFSDIILVEGDMYRDGYPVAVYIPVTGLYLFSLRGDTERRFARAYRNIVLYVAVNFSIVWTAHLEDTVPLGQMTSLSLQGGDNITVWVSGENYARGGILLSVAFAQP